jgi:hypothetical protein
MSAHCNYYSQHCIENCCDVNGRCPSYSQLPCYYQYYYNDPSNQIVQLPLPILMGIYVGVLLLVVPVIVLCFWWKTDDTDVKPEHN